MSISPVQAHSQPSDICDHHRYCRLALFFSGLKYVMYLSCNLAVNSLRPPPYTAGSSQPVLGTLHLHRKAPPPGSLSCMLPSRYMGQKCPLPRGKVIPSRRRSLRLTLCHKAGCCGGTPPQLPCQTPCEARALTQVGRFPGEGLGHRDMAQRRECGLPCALSADTPGP